MCRFPGLLPILGVCVAVVVAIAIGVAPATDDNASSHRSVQVVVRVERPALTLLSAQLFSSASRESTLASRGLGKLGSMTRETDETLPTRRLTQSPKRSAPEVAMIGEMDEHGPPFRR